MAEVRPTSEQMRDTQLGDLLLAWEADDFHSLWVCVGVRSWRHVLVVKQGELGVLRDDSELPITIWDRPVWGGSSMLVPREHLAVLDMLIRFRAWAALDKRLHEIAKTSGDLTPSTEGATNHE